MSKINFLKYIFKSIWTKKIITILMIIQMSIGIILIVDCYSNYKIINFPTVQIEEELGKDSAEIYFFKMNNLDLSENGAKRYFQFEKELKEEFGIENVGAHFTMHTHFLEIENDEKILEFRKNEVENTLRANAPEAIPHMRLDYGLYKLIDFEIVKGRELKEEDFNKNKEDIIPIVISDKYIDKIELGKILTHGYNESKYKIVGFFKNDAKWLVSGGSIYLKLDDLSNEFIIPMVMLKDDFLGAVAMEKSQNLYIRKPKEMLENEFKQMLIEIGNKNEFSLNTVSLKEELETYKEGNIEMIITTIIQAVFIIILVSLSISIIMIYSLKKKKKRNRDLNSKWND